MFKGLIIILILVSSIAYVFKWENVLYEIENQALRSYDVNITEFVYLRDEFKKKMNDTIQEYSFLSEYLGLYVVRELSALKLTLHRLLFIDAHIDQTLKRNLFFNLTEWDFRNLRPELQLVYDDFINPSIESHILTLTNIWRIYSTSYKYSGYILGVFLQDKIISELYITSLTCSVLFVYIRKLFFNTLSFITFNQVGYWQLNKISDMLFEVGFVSQVTGSMNLVLMVRIFWIILGIPDFVDIRGIYIVGIVFLIMFYLNLRSIKSTMTYKLELKANVILTTVNKTNWTLPVLMQTILTIIWNTPSLLLLYYNGAKMFRPLKGMIAPTSNSYYFFTITFIPVILIFTVIDTVVYVLAWVTSGIFLYTYLDNKSISPEVMNKIRNINGDYKLNIKGRPLEVRGYYETLIRGYAMICKWREEEDYLPKYEARSWIKDFVEDITNAKIDNKKLRLAKQYSVPIAYIDGTEPLEPTNYQKYIKYINYLDRAGKEISGLENNTELVGFAGRSIAEEEKEALATKLGDTTVRQFGIRYRLIREPELNMMRDPIRSRKLIISKIYDTGLEFSLNSDYEIPYDSTIRIDGSLKEYIEKEATIEFENGYPFRINSRNPIEEVISVCSIRFKLLSAARDIKDLPKRHATKSCFVPPVIVGYTIDPEEYNNMIYWDSMMIGVELFTYETLVQKVIMNPTYVPTRIVSIEDVLLNSVDWRWHGRRKFIITRPTDSNPPTPKIHSDGEGNDDDDDDDNKPDKRERKSSKGKEQETKEHKYRRKPNSKDRGELTSLVNEAETTGINESLENYFMKYVQQFNYDSDDEFIDLMNRFNEVLSQQEADGLIILDYEAEARKEDEIQVELEQDQKDYEADQEEIILKNDTMTQAKRRIRDQPKEKKLWNTDGFGKAILKQLGMSKAEVDESGNLGDYEMLPLTGEETNDTIPLSTMNEDQRRKNIEANNKAKQELSEAEKYYEELEKRPLPNKPQDQKEHTDLMKTMLNAVKKFKVPELNIPFKKTESLSYADDNDIELLAYNDKGSYIPPKIEPPETGTDEELALWIGRFGSKQVRVRFESTYMCRWNDTHPKYTEAVKAITQTDYGNSVTYSILIDSQNQRLPIVKNLLVHKTLLESLPITHNITTCKAEGFTLFRKQSIGDIRHLLSRDSYILRQFDGWMATFDDDELTLAIDIYIQRNKKFLLRFISEKSLDQWILRHGYESVDQLSAEEHPRMRGKRRIDFSKPLNIEESRDNTHLIEYMNSQYFYIDKSIPKNIKTPLEIIGTQKEYNIPIPKLVRNEELRSAILNLDPNAPVDTYIPVTPTQQLALQSVAKYEDRKIVIDTNEVHAGMSFSVFFIAMMDKFMATDSSTRIQIRPIDSFSLEDLSDKSKRAYPGFKCRKLGVQNKSDQLDMTKEMAKEYRTLALANKAPEIIWAWMGVVKASKPDQKQLRGVLAGEMYFYINNFLIFEAFKNIVSQSPISCDFSIFGGEFNRVCLKFPDSHIKEVLDLKDQGGRVPAIIGDLFFLWYSRFISSQNDRHMLGHILHEIFNAKFMFPTSVGGFIMKKSSGWVDGPYATSAMDTFAMLSYYIYNIWENCKSADISPTQALQAEIVIESHADNWMSSYPLPMTKLLSWESKNLSKMGQEVKGNIEQSKSIIGLELMGFTIKVNGEYYVGYRSYDKVMKSLVLNKRRYSNKERQKSYEAGILECLALVDVWCQEAQPVIRSLRAQYSKITPEIVDHYWKDNIIRVMSRIDDPRIAWIDPQIKEIIKETEDSEVPVTMLDLIAASRGAKTSSSLI